MVEAEGEAIMVVVLDSKLEAALRARAQRVGVAPEDLAISVLRDGLVSLAPEPQDEWERELLSAARPWGVSHTNADLSSEGVND